jgi:hypothetical protein
MTFPRPLSYSHDMTTEARLDRDRRSGATFSHYLHFEEKDALDAEAARRGVTPNAVLRSIVREALGLPV